MNETMRLVMTCGLGNCDRHTQPLYSIGLTTELPYRVKLSCGCWRWSFPGTYTDWSGKFLDECSIPEDVRPKIGGLKSIRLGDILEKSQDELTP